MTVVPVAAGRTAELLQTPVGIFELVEQPEDIGQRSTVPETRETTDAED